MPSNKSHNRERGAALLVVMSIVLMAGTSMAIEALLIKSKRSRADQKASIAMVEAKKALIAYAVIQGRLPCPSLTDTLSGYGQSATANATCTGPGQRVSFLPWTTLGLPSLVDGDKAPLLYAVSADFLNSIPANCLPASLPGRLTINGGSTNYAAIIISPGSTLSLLTRLQASNPRTILDRYLEGTNATLDSTNFQATRIITKTEDGTLFNDRLLGIACEEIVGQ
ncbi:MAG: hypothetical protein HQL94_03220 [Magnetococcales bacterium]|nr:hypothetical protein [Magnetococcales bacterium]MBF0438001.1 hypothetical protein [Magnetococcales bacterium]